MSVSDGEKVNAAISNAAWISKTDTSGNIVTGIFELRNVSSGGDIANPQQQINDNITAIAANLAQINLNTPAIAANTAEASSLRTLSGTAPADDDLGTFTGSIITDNVAIKTALQELETAVETVSGPLIFQGVWDADTNSPALASGVGTSGHFYIVSVAGSTNLDGITDWAVNDWAVFDGTVWRKVDNSELVTSVNGQTGAVTITFDDLSPNTTKGDITAHNGINNVRVPVGTDDQVLVANSAVAAGVEWQDNSGSGLGRVNFVANSNFDKNIDSWNS